jgi:hypothetical protein
VYYFFWLNNVLGGYYNLIILGIEFITPRSIPLLNMVFDNLFMIHKILANNWETPPEFSQSVIYYPPDKAGGYAQKTLTEFHGFDQYLIYQVK